MIVQFGRVEQAWLVYASCGVSQGYSPGACCRIHSGWLFYMAGKLCQLSVGSSAKPVGQRPQFLPFGPFHERLEPPHNMVAGFQEWTPQSKMEVHSIFTILPCKSYSTTSAIRYWSRWSQSSPQDQREETETLLLSEMSVKVTLVRTCGITDIGSVIFGKYNLPQYYQY